jgi:hypothetical protein
LGMALLLANALALYICRFQLCFSIAALNFAVPIAWYVGRRTMLSLVRETRSRCL